MKHIKQKIRSDKREFRIVEDGIIVDINNVGNIQNYKVNFNEIRRDEFINVKTAHPLAWLFILSGVLNVILLTTILTEFFQTSFEQGKWIFIGAFAVFLIIIVTLKDHFQKVDIKNLDANKPLSFIYTKKYKSEVDKFINQIHLEQKEFFKKNYYRIDAVLPFDVQKNRILWLYENKYIAENEYKAILKELENKRLIDGE
jgi:uncharacterized membrane protein